MSLQPSTDAVGEDKNSEGLIGKSGIDFAKQFIGTIEVAAQSDSADVADVARFRLISTVLGEQGNDEGPIGPHDANLIFKNRSRYTLSRQEQGGLLRSGLIHLSSENVPLWYWVDLERGPTGRGLSINSILGTADKRCGAISAMTLVEEQREYDDVLDRAFYLQNWLGLNTPVSIRIVALQYLSELGDLEDIPAIVAELERGDYQTTNLAETAIIRIAARDSSQAAIQKIFELKPKKVDEAVLEEIFSGNETLQISSLNPGLEHPCAEVRKWTLKTLREAKALSVADADKLMRDDDAAVRYEALIALRETGRQLGLRDLKLALIKPMQPRGLGGLSILAPNPSIDWDGEAAFRKIEAEELLKMETQKLEEIARDETIFDRAATFALIDRQWPEPVNFPR